MAGKGWFGFVLLSWSEILCLCRWREMGLPINNHHQILGRKVKLAGFGNPFFRLGESEKRSPTAPADVSHIHWICRL
jgi:hypothetical protein